MALLYDGGRSDFNIDPRRRAWRNACARGVRSDPRRAYADRGMASAAPRADPRSVGAPQFAWAAMTMDSAKPRTAMSENNGVKHARPAPPKDLIKIGDFAELAGTNLRTLRYYEEIGLLAPAARSAGGFRYYRREDLDRLRMVASLQDLANATGGSVRTTASPSELSQVYTEISASLRTEYRLSYQSHQSSGSHRLHTWRRC